ncbi:MAG: hypothetical protein QM526_01915 [Alphaproteobacteria bacterium]|nr:hypothetical protein [Alphaproteobacteria bacterium]
MKILSTRVFIFVILIVASIFLFFIPKVWFWPALKFFEEVKNFDGEPTKIETISGEYFLLRVLLRPPQIKDDSVIVYSDIAHALYSKKPVLSNRGRLIGFISYVEGTNKALVSLLSSERTSFYVGVREKSFIGIPKGGGIVYVIVPRAISFERGDPVYEQETGLLIGTVEEILPTNQSTEQILVVAIDFNPFLDGYVYTKK